jgi:hypothetical protein
MSKYEERDVLNGNKVLDAFTSYMNSISFPFNYDIAIGLLK